MAKKPVGTKTTPVAATAEIQKIRLQPLEMQEMKIGIRGLTTLVVHHFSEKARGDIERDQGKGSSGAKKKIQPPRVPRDEYLRSFYMMPGSTPPESKGARYGIPVVAFKLACATVASRYINDFSGAYVKGAFFVHEDAGGLVELTGSKPYMRTDTVRIGTFKDKFDLRYRGCFDQWACSLRIRYNPILISAEQIVMLLQWSGAHVGIFELRAEKGYSCGTYEPISAPAPRRQRAGR